MEIENTIYPERGAKVPQVRAVLTLTGRDELNQFKRIIAAGSRLKNEMNSEKFKQLATEWKVICSFEGEEERGLDLALAVQEQDWAALDKRAGKTMTEVERIIAQTGASLPQLERAEKSVKAKLEQKTAELAAKEGGQKPSAASEEQDARWARPEFTEEPTGETTEQPTGNAPEAPKKIVVELVDLEIEIVALRVEEALNSRGWLEDPKDAKKPGGKGAAPTGGKPFEKSAADILKEQLNKLLVAAKLGAIAARTYGRVRVLQLTKKRELVRSKRPGSKS